VEFIRAKLRYETTHFVPWSVWLVGLQVEFTLFPDLSLSAPAISRNKYLGPGFFLDFNYLPFQTPSDIFNMSEEEQMFLVDEEQADEDGETSVLWKKRHRQVIDPCGSLPVYNTIHG